MFEPDEAIEQKLVSFESKIQFILCGSPTQKEMEQKRNDEEGKVQISL